MLGLSGFLHHDKASILLHCNLAAHHQNDWRALSTEVRPYHFDEINLNVGCPSDRVQSGRFGACLMAEPALVADCMTAMAQATMCLSR